jgi:hypothetical protein
MRVSFRINGDPVAVEVEPRLHLADCLRDVLSLTGTHLGGTVNLSGGGSGTQGLAGRWRFIAKPCHRFPPRLGIFESWRLCGPRQ